MGCNCGKKLVNIAQGNIKNLTDAAGITAPYPFRDNRVRICHTCEKQTWMTWVEYTKLMASFGIVDVAKNISDLSKLPELPKYALDDKRRNIFCMICKCFIPAKANVVSEHCPLNKW